MAVARGPRGVQGGAKEDIVDLIATVICMHPQPFGLKPLLAPVGAAADAQSASEEKNKRRQKQSLNTDV